MVEKIVWCKNENTKEEWFRFQGERRKLASIVDTTTLMSRKTAHPFPTPPALYDCLGK